MIRTAVLAGLYVLVLAALITLAFLFVSAVYAADSGGKPVYTVPVSSPTGPR